MIRHKWIVGVRNKVSSLSMECDSAASIEGSRLTALERRELKEKFRDIVNYIDKKVFD